MQQPCPQNHTRLLKITAIFHRQMHVRKGVVYNMLTSSLLAVKIHKNSSTEILRKYCRLKLNLICKQRRKLLKFAEPAT